MSKRASVNEPQTEDERVMAFLDRFEREKQAKKVRFEEPSTDMIGKTVVIVDGRDHVATPLVVGFVIDEAMPLRLRQSIRVADDGAKTADGLVQEADSEDADSEEQKQEDKDCEELNEFLTKQLTTDKPPLLLSKPNFVIYLQ